jgi:hypothetical protein
LFIDATSRLLRNLNERKFHAWIKNFMFDTRIGFNIFPFPKPHPQHSKKNKFP